MFTDLSSSLVGAVQDAIAPLVAALDAACAGFSDQLQASVTEALVAAAGQPDLLTAAQRTGVRGNYVRHVLHADPRGRYTLVALIWGAGQFSPVHGHYTWCGYAVIDGCLQESTYRLSSGETSPRCEIASAERRRGDVRFSHAGLDEIHRLGNAGTIQAISIHAYGIDAPRVATHVNRLLPIAA